MCRMVAYLGQDVLLSDVIVKPKNSIVMQSLHARESDVPTNGDGFGLGWYTPDISNKPALFTSTFPAWNDQNLLNLSSKIMSPAFFTHVRAASIGDVSHYNCHPFVYKQWLFMHNGGVHDFINVKRHLRHLLDDDIYHWIKGETDSEHVFALWLQCMRKKNFSKLTSLANGLLESIETVENLIHKYSKLGVSRYNICITDGKRLVACRFCSNPKIKPETLHYSIGERYIAQENRYHMLPPGHVPGCILVTSEKLTDYDMEWHDVPPNHLLMVDENFLITLQKI